MQEKFLYKCHINEKCTYLDIEYYYGMYKCYINGLIFILSWKFLTIFCSSIIDKKMKKVKVKRTNICGKFRKKKKACGNNSDIIYIEYCLFPQNVSFEAEKTNLK